MTKPFFKCELEKEIDDMSKEELQLTLADMMERHELNLESREELKEELNFVKAGLIEELQHSLPLKEDELMEFSVKRLRELSLAPSPEEEQDGEPTSPDSAKSTFAREDKPSKIGHIPRESDVNARGRNIIKGMPGINF